MWSSHIVRAGSRWIADRGDSRATVHGDDLGAALDDLAGGHLSGRPAVTPFRGLWSVEVPGGRVGPQDRLTRWLHRPFHAQQRNELCCFHDEVHDVEARGRAVLAQSGASDSRS